MHTQLHCYRSTEPHFCRDTNSPARARGGGGMLIDQYLLECGVCGGFWWWRLSPGP